MRKAGWILLAVTAMFIVLTCLCFIPRIIPNEALTPTQNHATIPGENTRININTASALQLQALPGIGPALSDAIVQYREQHGPFQKVGDLILVPGIGQGRLENILDQITIGG